MNPRLTTYFAACALVALSALKAGSAQPDELSWSTINNGGGTSTNAFFGLSGTIGQTDSETMSNEYSSMTSNNIYQIQGGFWPAALLTRPLVATSSVNSVTANLESNITFRATPVGTPPFRFQWQLNGFDLIGETNDTLSIASLQVTNGGSYQCIIVNAYGTTNSSSIELRINLPIFPAHPGGQPVNDNFVNAAPIDLTNLTFRSSNVGATNETGEPRHAGKLGGSSVWYSWSTNASGIATFRTEGSAFDTLLAVYTGNSFGNLVASAEDDDTGRSYASVVRFNVSSNVTYLIAVDGVGGAHGGYVVRWDFTNTNEKLPRITCHPRSQSVRHGTNGVARFGVEVDGGTNELALTYQWIFNGHPIAGATSSTLTISNVTPLQIGLYWVGVTNADHQGLESHRASLEFGPKSTAVSYSKIENLLVNSGLFGPPSGLCGPPLAERFFVASGLPSIQSITFGYNDRNSARFTTLDGTNHSCSTSCDDLGVTAKYYGLLPTNSGVLTLSTSNSVYGPTSSRLPLDTIMIVYEYSIYSAFRTNTYQATECTNAIACDDDGGPDRSSQLSIPVFSDRYYVVEVDSKSGQTNGEVTLTWDLEKPATPFRSNGNLLYLTAPTNLSLYPYITNYSWLSNNTVLSGYTDRTLLLDATGLSASTFAVAMYVQNTNATYWSVERVTNTLGTLVSIRQNNGFELMLPGFATASLSNNFEVEAVALSGTNPGTIWPWQKLTNFTTYSTGNHLIVRFPTNQTAQSFRLRPKSR